jgi:hypothetical protein
MSIYTELLSAALGEADPEEYLHISVDELLANWSRCRRALENDVLVKATSAQRADARIGELLACDVLLVQLCRRLGIEEHLTDPNAGPQERERVERSISSAGVSA